MNGADSLFDDLVRRWRRRRAQVTVLYGLAVAVAIAGGGLAEPATGQRWFALALAGAVLLGAVVAGANRWRPRADDARRLALHFDRELPSLQESGELLLGRADSGLAEVQRRRALRALSSLAAVGTGGGGAAGLLPRWPRARLAATFAASLALSLGCAALAGWLQNRGAPAPQPGAARSGVNAPTAAAAAPATIAVIVTPPSYTGRPPRVAAALDVEAEESALVRWRIGAPAAAAGALVFDDGELPLARDGAGALVAELTATASQVYSLVLRAPALPEYRSATARLAVLPDRPPNLSIAPPPPLTVLAPAAVGRLRVEVAAADDYGLAALELVATLAHGAGEQVEFRVERLALAPLASAGENAARFARTLDLRALGMVAGSELYLQAEARDRRAPRPNLATSEVARVRVEGGGGESVGLDRGLPQVRVEASLRSQRQIIADTERLLAERPRTTAAEFLERSEALGFDQRALRLRYGGLLGEEFESGAPAGEEEHAGEEPPGAAGSAAMAALPEGMVHRHDSEEVATYFDDPERARMKAALAEMWGAEGHLRLGDPRAALPFEYRALRLLKSAQEQARRYVAKLGSELPKLDPGKRLTGDLAGIGDRRLTMAPSAAPAAPAHAALAAVAALRAGAVDAAGTDRARAALAASRPALAAAAAAAGGPALAALDALAAVDGRLERGDAPAAGDLATLERGLAAILPAPLPAPLAAVRAGSLEERYRRALAAAGDDG